MSYEGAGTYDLPRLRALLDANFGVWGPVTNIYIKHDKAIAFVRSGRAWLWACTCTYMKW